MADLSGHDVNNCKWTVLEDSPETLKELLKEFGKMYAPTLVANAKAKNSGNETWEIEIDGSIWKQKTFSYQAKCLKWIKDEFNVLNEHDDEMINKMKRGAYIVNTARGKICDKDAIARALESGQLSGYAGDVWFPQPAPNDHVWRTMPNHGMTPHTSGTSLSAQARYAAGVREILECFFSGEPIREPYLIVKDGDLAGMGAHSYTKGTATDGSEEAANYKK